MGGSTLGAGDNAVENGAHDCAIGNEDTARVDKSGAFGNGAVSERAKKVSVGAAGQERQIVNVAAGTSDTDAVNVAQLNKATASAVHYDVNSDGSINYNSVSFGDPSGTGGPVSLHNDDAGPAPTAAVNGEKMMAVDDNVLNRQEQHRG